MIQSQTKFANYLENDEQIPFVSTKTRRNSISRSAALTRCALFVLVFSVVFTFLHIQNSLLGYRVVELKKDIAALETDNKRIELQIARLSSLERVQRVAETKMGMYRPDAACMIAMAGENRPVPVVKTAVKPAEEQPVITMKSLYQGIASIFDEQRTISMK